MAKDIILRIWGLSTQNESTFGLILREGGGANELKLRSKCEFADSKDFSRF